ncbi:unnamed protein product [Amoebophrya sp. A120]|nr:unnamed protein product [Amoebophrya sp. A120]|eukprot:GSA120T00013322001.1
MKDPYRGTWYLDCGSSLGVLSESNKDNIDVLQASTTVEEKRDDFSNCGKCSDDEAVCGRDLFTPSKQHLKPNANQLTCLTQGCLGTGNAPQGVTRFPSDAVKDWYNSITNWWDRSNKRLCCEDNHGFCDTVNCNSAIWGTGWVRKDTAASIRCYYEPCGYQALQMKERENCCVQGCSDPSSTNSYGFQVAGNNWLVLREHATLGYPGVSTYQNVPTNMLWCNSATHENKGTNRKVKCSGSNQPQPLLLDPQTCVEKCSAGSARDPGICGTDSDFPTKTASSVCSYNRCLKHVDFDTCCVRKCAHDPSDLHGYEIDGSKLREQGSDGAFPGDNNWKTSQYLVCNTDTHVQMTSPVYKCPSPGGRLEIRNTDCREKCSEMTTAFCTDDENLQSQYVIRTDPSNYCLTNKCNKNTEDHKRCCKKKCTFPNIGSCGTGRVQRSGNDGAECESNGDDCNLSTVPGDAAACCRQTCTMSWCNKQKFGSSNERQHFLKHGDAKILCAGFNCGYGPGANGVDVSTCCDKGCSAPWSSTQSGGGISWNTRYGYSLPGKSMELANWKDLLADARPDNNAGWTRNNNMLRCGTGQTSVSIGGNSAGAVYRCLGPNDEVKIDGCRETCNHAHACNGSGNLQLKPNAGHCGKNRCVGGYNSADEQKCCLMKCSHSAPKGHCEGKSWGGWAGIRDAANLADTCVDNVCEHSRNHDTATCCAMKCRSLGTQGAACQLTGFSGVPNQVHTGFKVRSSPQNYQCVSWPCFRDINGGDHNAVDRATCCTETCSRAESDRGFCAGFTSSSNLDHFYSANPARVNSQCGNPLCSGAGDRDNVCCWRGCRKSVTTVPKGYVISSNAKWRNLLDSAPPDAQARTSSSNLVCASTHTGTAHYACNAPKNGLALTGCREQCFYGRACQTDTSKADRYLQRPNAGGILCATNDCQGNAADTNTCCIQGCKKPSSSQSVLVRYVINGQKYPSQDWDKLVKNTAFYPGGGFRASGNLHGEDKSASATVYFSDSFSCNTVDFQAKTNTGLRFKCSGVNQNLQEDPTNGCHPKCICTRGTLDPVLTNCPAPHAQKCTACTSRPGLDELRHISANDGSVPLVLKHLWPASAPSYGTGRYYDNTWCWPKCENVACGSHNADQESRPFYQKNRRNPDAYFPEHGAGSMGTVVTWCDNHGDSDAVCKTDLNCCRKGCMKPKEKTGYVISWKDALIQNELYPATGGRIFLLFL